MITKADIDCTGGVKVVPLAGKDQDILVVSKYFLPNEAAKSRIADKLTRLKQEDLFK